jgi:assimilatory nitrate reductase catalytic subunit
VGLDSRLLVPAFRATRDHTLTESSWDDTLDFVSRRFAEVIKTHGPDAVAFYVSGQLTTEDYYVFNKLAKGFIGTNNIDTNSRLCMSSAAAAYKKTLGADAPPCCYDDFDDTDCYLITGSNMAYAHPVAFRRIEAARAKKPQQKMIVVDPRRTATAEMADLHLALKPGTDIVLYNAMLQVLIWEGWIHRDFIAQYTEGFDALRAHVREFTPKVAASLCGLKESDILQAAEWWGEAPNALSLWCQGLNQSHHGTDNGAALIALSLATGKIGRPGSGPFSLTGQPNAMGGREVGGMANLLPGHRDMLNPAHREEVARLWGVPSIPAEPGLTAVELFKAVREGSVKAVWIVCTNPAQSMPDLGEVSTALAACECVVVQEAFSSTETMAFADVVLPATTWAEKDGTVTNSERCITRVAPAIEAPGEAHHDWRIAIDFAHQLGRVLGREEDAKRLFSFTTSAEIYEEHCALTAGRDLDISGLSYQRLEEHGPMQWPVPDRESLGTARLYTDFKFPTPSTRAAFIVPAKGVTAEVQNSRYPFALITGRLRDQWHGMSRTGRVAQLQNHVDEPRIEMTADDMTWRGIEKGALVRVTSRRGSVILKAVPSEELKAGEVFVAMHWGRARLSHLGVNALTQEAYDPVSKQPELKFTAVHIEKADLPFELFMMVSGEANPEGTAHIRSLQTALCPLLERFAYAASYIIGRDKAVLVLSIQHHDAIPTEWIAELDALFGLQDENCLTLADKRRGIEKRARFVAHTLKAIRLLGETRAQNWLKSLMSSASPMESIRAWVLAPLRDPPVAGAQRGETICSCMDVDAEQIKTAIKAGADLHELQATLKCGTQCGSCLPEVRRLLLSPPRG